MTAGVGRGVREARWPQDRDVVEDLFREYVAGLGVGVSFQKIEQVFSTLPGRYARPSGCVLLAGGDGEPAGVVAPSDDRTGRRRNKAALCSARMA